MSTPGPTDSCAIVEGLEADLVDVDAAAEMGDPSGTPESLEDVASDAADDAADDASEPPD